MAKTCGTNIMSPFLADPPVLRTILFEGADDEEDNESPLKAKVKPNFRTPPR
jgi:hypothetical protein